MSAGVAVVLTVACVCGSVLVANGHDVAAGVLALAATTVAVAQAVTRR